ncbi:hypothetical protein IMZ48_06260 [Candidatus Bathyarchaeota archaeon]|nr:hypothetical protein [Candidatus Bathyarchaeota archaeon]
MTEIIVATAFGVDWQSGIACFLIGVSVGYTVGRIVAYELNARGKPI